MDKSMDKMYKTARILVSVWVSESQAGEVTG